jgi:DNA polymerase-3 subunit gamma/tau
MPDGMKQEKRSPEPAAGENKSKEVFYRKYRFSSFSNMCGQQQVASFFINTIKYNKISHAYLFSGPRGTGKTSMARLFAKILNCSEKTSFEPCGKCRNCVEFDRGSAVDIIEMDAASNRKIDDIRSLRDDVTFMPINGKYKIFILDEAHMLTTEAANAFLKTLEEPPPYVIFILATTEHHKIPATILSRCQLVKFSRIAVADIVKRLEFVIGEENAIRDEGQKIICDRAALFLIAKKANGGMRDALSLLEYVIALGGGIDITGESVENILGMHSTGQIKNFIESVYLKKPETGLEIIKKVYETGNELLSFLESVNSYLSSLTLVKIGVSNSSALDCDEDDFAALREAASRFEAKDLMALLEIYSECLSQIRFAPDQRSHLEFVYIKSILSPGSGSANPQAQASAVPSQAVQPALDYARIEKMIGDKISQAAEKFRQAGGPSKPSQASSGAPAGTSAGGHARTQLKPGESKLTLERIKLIWASSFLGRLKEISLPTHAIISSGALSKYSDGVLEIDFTKNAFCGERMNSGIHLKHAEEAFAQTYEEEVKIRIVLPAQEKAARVEQRKKEMLEEKKNDPTVKLLLEEFDGEIIDVEEQ